MGISMKRGMGRDTLNESNIVPEQNGIVFVQSRLYFWMHQAWDNKIIQLH